MRAQGKVITPDQIEAVWIFAAVGIRADLEPSAGLCLQCGGATEVQKSVEHRVVTLEHGDFIAHETVHVCKARCRQASGELVTRRSEALLLKISPGKVYGYDVETYVGIERFLHHRQREEIRSELAQRYGINISSGQVSGDKLETYLTNQVGNILRKSQGKNEIRYSVTDVVSDGWATRSAAFSAKYTMRHTCPSRPLIALRARAKIVSHFAAGSQL